MAGGWSDVSLPLYSACCLHAAAAAAAAVKAGGGAVPAASCRILGVAAAKKDRKVTVSYKGSAVGLARIFNTLRNVVFEARRKRKERRLKVNLSL